MMMFRRVAWALAPVLVAIAAPEPAVAQQDETLNGDLIVFAAPDLIPRRVFFGNPDRANVQVSPDGAHISYLAPHDGVMNVWVQPLGEGEARPVTSATQRPIRIYFWAHNNQQIIYVQDRNGDENYHVYAVDLESRSETDLTPLANIQARIIARDRDRPDEILVGLNDRDPQSHDVWLIHTRTGDKELVFQNDGGYARIDADSSYTVRLVSKVVKETGGLITYMRETNEQPWSELARWDLEDAAASGPMGISRDGDTVYLMDSRGVNTGRLYAYQITGPDGPAYELIAADERADLDEIVFDPKTYKPQAVAFEYAQQEWRILDNAIRPDWEFLKRQSPGQMSIASRSHADDKWIVNYVVDDGPVKYFLYDRARRKAQFLFSNRSELEGLPLAKMQPVVIRSRDGLELVSYLTTPRERSENLPMVLLVHGGPWARDSWGFNSVHQWLANRGYAVLSVNFRGSTGFGKKFMNAGNKEWAAKMHDDLVDAVNWAVGKGIADPDKVAIMGGSYGGYATLVGLTFTPDFFAAGVDIVGPSHVRTLLETIPPYWEHIKAMFENRVGSLDDPEFLDRISPLTKVDQIRKPLLIGQGKNDPRVKESESLQIVDAMQEKGLPVTYVVFPDEGHGFARPENNMAFLAITEAFLAQHLGGQFEPIQSELRQSSAVVQAGADLVPGLREALPQ